jgi:hypothetical protein
MNKIIFNIVDGAIDSCEMDGTLYTYKYRKPFGVEQKELETDKVLLVGDHIKYMGYETKVCERIYYPGADKFDFLCYNIYTGRKE